MWFCMAAGDVYSHLPNLQSSVVSALNHAVDYECLK